MKVEECRGRVFQSPGPILSNKFGAVGQSPPSQFTADLFRDLQRGIHVGGLGRLLEDVLELGLQGPAAGTGLPVEQR